MSYRILVTGGRDYENGRAISDALEEFYWGGAVVLHGGARGADTMAGTRAMRLGYDVEVYPANWDRDGKAAGSIRNRRMRDNAGGVDLVIAFPGGAGTANMVTAAHERRIEVVHRG